MKTPTRARTCNEVCQDAIGPTCTCACEGENHGLGFYGLGLADRAFEATVDDLARPSGWPAGTRSWTTPTPATPAPVAAPVAPARIGQNGERVLLAIMIVMFLLRLFGYIHY